MSTSLVPVQVHILWTGYRHSHKDQVQDLTKRFDNNHVGVRHNTTTMVETNEDDMNDPSKEKRRTTKKCMHSSQCRIAKCKFRHPSVVSSTCSTKAMSAIPAFPSAIPDQVSSAVKKQTGINHCRHGGRCRHPNCSFAHPAKTPGGDLTPITIPVTQDGLTRKQQSSSTSKEPQLKSMMTRATSQGFQTKEETSSLRTPNASRQYQRLRSEPSLLASLKKIKKKACRFGDKCHSPTCKFVHPPTTVSMRAHMEVQLAVPEPLHVSKEPTLPSVIAELDILHVADLEKALFEEASEQQQKKKLPPLRRGQEEAARLLREENEIDDLLKEQEMQRLADAENWARGAPAVFGQQQQVPFAVKSNTASPATHSMKNVKQAHNTMVSPEGAPCQASVKAIQAVNGLPPQSVLRNSTQAIPTEAERSVVAPPQRHKPQKISKAKHNAVQVQLQTAPSNVVPIEGKLKYDIPSQPVSLAAVDKSENGSLKKRKGPSKKPAKSINLGSLESEPTRRYTVQLQQLREMEFEKEETVLASLESNDGDLSDAVEILLSQPPSDVPVMVESDQVPSRQNERVHVGEFLLNKGLRQEPLQQMRDMVFYGEEGDAKPEMDGNENAAIELLVSRLPVPSPPVLVAEIIGSSVEAKVDEDQLGLEREERQSQKAARKAAKKDRRRLQIEAKAIQTVNTANSLREEYLDHIKYEEDEEQNKLRWREELRRQKERGAEKKEAKKNRRREEIVKDLERQAGERAESWKSAIAEEQKSTALIIKLCVAEFCRAHTIFDKQRVLKDGKASQLIEECQAAFRMLYLPCRVVVKGMKQQELNDRTGIIDHWEDDEGKFCVSVETKKGKQCQLMYFLPGNLEMLASDASKKSRVKSSDPVYSVNIASMLPGLDLLTEIFKSDIDRMKEAPSVDHLLVTLMQERQQEERLTRKREEEDRRLEVEARQRRAKQRAKEQNEWDERQRQYNKKKEAYKQWRSENKKANASGSGGGHRNGGCSCPECMFERLFFGGRGSRDFPRAGFATPGFAFFVGGSRGGGFYTTNGDDYYGSEDEWDRQWNNMHDEEEAEKYQEAAELLGVSVDASTDEIKRVFRKKALKYHPDKYRAEHHDDGVTKDDAEDHFKELSSAYDHLMSRRDD